MTKSFNTTTLAAETQPSVAPKLAAMFDPLKPTEPDSTTVSNVQQQQYPEQGKCFLACIKKNNNNKL